MNHDSKLLVDAEVQNNDLESSGSFLFVFERH